MLAVLSTAQKEALGQGQNSLLRAAFNQSGKVDGPTVTALVQAGVPLSGLDSAALISAIHSADHGLFGLLLDHGLKLDEARVPANGSAVRPLLVEALAGKRPDLILRLLQAGANPNLPDNTGNTAVAWAVALGDLGALDALLAAGGRFEQAVSNRNDRSLLELALSSPNEAILSRLPGAADLSGVCLKNAARLRRVVLDSSDAFWSKLLSLGLGRQVEGGACAALASFPERLISSMLDEQDSFAAGWRGTRLNGRLRDLVAQAYLPEERARELFVTAQSAGRSDLVAALSGVGVQAVATAKSPALPIADKASSADVAMQKKLVGRYHLVQQREVGSEILLRANGQFEYMLAYGATDEAATGQWRVRGGRVLFNTPESLEAPGHLPYRRMAAANGGKGDSASLEVVVTYQGRPVHGLAVTALGCSAPAMAFGRTDARRWRGSVASPLCQIVLRHPQIYGGRSFVYQVPANEQASQGQRFVFTVAPSSVNDRQAFNVEMAVVNEALHWERAGRIWRYVRQ